MKIEFSGNKNLKITCLDRDLLLAMQDRMDGIKIRMQPQIIVPVKAIMHIGAFVHYGIEYGPDVEATLNAIRNNNEKRKINIYKIKGQYDGEISFNYECKGIYAPLKHQKIMYNAIYFNDCCAVLAEPGTCKTAAYLWAIDKRIQTNKIKKALIVTLSDLKYNVVAEAKIQTPHLKLVVLDGLDRNKKIINKSFKIKSKNIDYHVYVANYESMDSISKILPEDYFDMVILDEAHRVGSPRSNQTKAIVEAFESTKFKHVITGTLFANNLMSFYMPFRFLGADTVPYSTFDAFRQTYMYPVDPDRYIWVPIGGAKEVVSKIVGDISVSFTKEECLDLPPRIYEKYYCEMEGDQKALYQQMEKDLVGTIDNMCNKCDKKNKCDNNCADELTVKSALVLYGKLHQIASGFYINTKVSIDDFGHVENDSNIIELDSKSKMHLLIDALKNIPSNRQVIIWTNYVYAVKMIYAELIKTFGKDSVITCYGDQNAFEQVNIFRDKKTPYCVANPTKMGVGQNIQFSNYQIFYTNSYSWVVRDQAEGRQHRQGQKENVTIIDLLTKGTVDELRLEALMNKQDLALTLSQLSKVIKRGSLAKLAEI